MGRLTKSQVDQDSLINVSLWMIDMNTLEDEMQEEFPEKPRKVDEDFPEDVSILTAEAKLGKDTRNQYFVRIPKEVAEALDFKTVRKIKFIVTTPLPNSTPENADLQIELIRE
jgi:hypothetical protein